MPQKQQILVNRRAVLKVSISLLALSTCGAFSGSWYVNRRAVSSCHADKRFCNLHPRLGRSQLYEGVGVSYREDKVDGIEQSSNNIDGAERLSDEIDKFDGSILPPLIVTPESKEKPSVLSATAGAKQKKGSGASKIIRFAVPAIGVWLCGPLLSMIDTSAVGLLSGTADQAALSPAVAVTDYSALLVAFLYTATTNQVASAQEANNSTEGKAILAQVLKGSLKLSGFVGLFLGSMVLLFSKVLLKAIIGNDSIDPAVFGPALRYVRIRALGMPAAAVIGSAQSACLGMKDIKAPFLVLAAAAIFNFIGDMTFVASKNPWIGGAAGAAWATVLSQYMAVMFFFRWLLTKPKPKKERLNGESNSGSSSLDRIDITDAILKQTSNPLKINLESLEGSALNNIVSTGRRMKETVKKIKSIKMKRKKGKSSPSRGFLIGHLNKRDILSFPTKSTFNDFVPYVFPVTMTSVGRVSMYVAMNYVVSSTLGTISMAAQQILLSVFFCLCPIADSLNLTAQSFVPPIFERKRSQERTNELKQIVRDFAKVSAMFGAAMSAIVCCIPMMNKFFTNDPSVIAAVNSVVPLFFLNFLIHGGVCAGEGILLGQRDLGFLGKAFTSFFAVVPYLMIRLKSTMGSKLSLPALWKVFVGYNIFRLCMWVVRILHLERETIKNSSQPTITVVDDLGISHDSLGKPLTEVSGLSNTTPPEELVFT